MARGHRIDQISEIPLIVEDSTFVHIQKTRVAVSILKALNAYPDIQKVIDSKHIRAGKGKMRNRRYVKRRGPLIVYDKKNTFIRAFRNIPGIQFCCVHHLNLLKLAPGGHLGRFVIWTKSAFQQLDKLYGTYSKPSELKIGFRLPRVALTNSDLGRLINSQEVQSHLRAKKRPQKYVVHKKNPLKNFGFLIKLNPYAKTERRRTILEAKNAQERKKWLKSRREASKAAKKEKAAKSEKKESRGKTATAYRKLFVKTLLS